MVKTITIINPKCVRCINKENCNNKTFMFALVNEIDCKYYKPMINDAHLSAQESCIYTDKMKLQDDIKKALNKELKINVGIDWGRSKTMVGLSRWR